MKSILIISHAFPPVPGIGGRRWAKFSKELLKRGYKVNVIASKNIHKDESSWMDDVVNVPVEYLPYKFPSVLGKSKFNLLEKFLYRFWLVWLKTVNKGNFYDKTFFWGNQIKHHVRKQIKANEIDTIIVTMAPFLLGYYVTQLKGEFPDIKFVVDFRDLWTTDSEITAFSSLSHERISVEKERELSTVKNADVVLTVADKMSNYFRSLAASKSVYTLPNGFDPDDFRNISSATLETNDKINLVFTGTLYLNLGYILKPFFKQLAEIRVKNSSLYSKLNVNFYGTFPVTYKSMIDEFGLQDVVKVWGNVSLNETYQRIAEASACLLFLNDTYNFSLSTKFCEYIGLRKKIIVVSNYGETAQFVTTNHIGYWFDPNGNSEILEKQLNEILTSNNDIADSSKFDYSQYSLVKITDQLEKIINEK